MSTITTTGKTLEEAIKKGLAEFNCNISDVDVKVLKHPGVFSQGMVEMTYIGENPGQKTAGSIMRNLQQKITSDQKSKNESRNQKNQNNKNIQGNQKPQQNQPKQQNAQGNQKPQQNQPKQQNAQGNQKPQQNQPKQQNVQGNQKPQQNQPKQQNAQGNQKPQQNQPKQQNVQGNQKPQQDQSGNVQEQKEIKQITPEQLDQAKEKGTAYLEKLLKLMDVNANLTVDGKDDEISINIGSDDITLIGYHGETLDSLEYLTLLAANPGEDKNVHVSLDCAGYREKRLQALKENALKKADAAVKSGRPERLEPMNSSVRRVIHALLSEREDVITRSDGKEPNRFIMIIPKKNKSQGDKPGKVHDEKNPDRNGKPFNGDKKKNQKKGGNKKPGNKPEKPSEGENK